MEDPRKLRELAAWYREFAERAGNPAIWHARLTTAEGLEREADRLEKMVPPGHMDRATGLLSETEDRLADGSSGVSRCLLLALPRPLVIRALGMRHAGEMQMRQSSTGIT